MGPKPNGADEKLDIEQLGIQGLAFLNAPVALLVLDDDNRVVGVNYNARRLIYPKKDSSKSWASNVLLRNLPIQLSGEENRRQTTLDIVLQTARENLESAERSGSSFHAALNVDNRPTPIAIQIDVSTVRTSHGTRFTNLSLLPDTTSDAALSLQFVSDERDTIGRYVGYRDEILDHLKDLAVFCVDKNGNLLFGNTAGKMVMPTDEAIEGKGVKWVFDTFNIYELDFSRRITFEEWGVTDLLTNGVSIHQTLAYYDPQGKQTIFELGGTPVKDDSGNLVAGIFWFKDETKWYEIENQTYRNICDSMPQMMMVLPVNNEQPEYMNKTWWDYTGIDRKLGLRIPEIMDIICHEEDLELTSKVWQNGMETGTDIENRFRCRRHDGVYKWVLRRMVPIKDENGQIVKWYGALTDVDEQSEAIEEAHRVRRQLEEAIRHTQLELLTIDNTSDYRISAIEGKRMLPELEGLKVGASMLKVFQSAKQFLAPVQRLMKDGETALDITEELELQNRWFRARYTPIFSDDRKRGASPGIDGPVLINGRAVVGVVMVVAEVTARYRQQIKLELTTQQKKELEERESVALKSAKLKAEFLANASHEIRTPISQIIGMSEVLLDTELEAEQRGYTKNILDSASGLRNLISDILDLSKIEAGKMSITKGPFDLTSLLNSIVDMFKLTTSQKGLHFEHLSTLKKEDSQVVGDQGRVRQILTNLLGNAFKFTSEGFIRMTTILDKTASTDSTVTITFVVEDSGIGISESAIKKLFLPFSQANENTSAKFGGTGLGLSISKELVELMHGKIALERSKGGPGVVAWFTIPFERYDGDIKEDTDNMNDSEALINRFRFDIERTMPQDDTAIPGPNNYPPSPRRTLPAKSPISKAAPSTMPPPTRPESHRRTSPTKPPTEFDEPVNVILVEDDMIIRTFAVKNLEKLGCKVVTANNGVEGLAAIEKALAVDALPDIVITDCRMPVMDGYELTKRIRGHKDLRVRRLVVIAMTASSLSEEQEKCSAVGMNDFLSKPAKREEMLAVLRKYIVQKDARGEHAVVPPSGPNELSRMGTF